MARTKSKYNPGIPGVPSVPRVAKAKTGIPGIKAPKKPQASSKSPINTIQPAKEPTRPAARMDMSAPSPIQAGPYQGLGPAPFGEGAHY